jgi:hypothetical protein
MTYEIVVSSGRTLPHPTMNYASLRADISVKFTVDETETGDVDAIIKSMQDWADRTSLNHIHRMIKRATQSLDDEN